ncbi:MAG: hypothetical protein GXP10_01790 [Gammaproteobacteria bacterium]|nr:hypothetical protein [Gammaproteobacteria bacterium]
MKQSKTPLTTESLRSLIGTLVSYQGANCQIIEILEDEMALVLEARDAHTTIQPDQHGEAHRRVAHTVTIPILCSEKGEVNPDFASLICQI